MCALVLVHTMLGVSVYNVNANKGVHMQMSTGLQHMATVHKLQVKSLHVMYMILHKHLDIFFQVSKSKFDDMRYNVALALKEIDDLEKRSVLKIKDKS